MSYLGRGTEVSDYLLATETADHCIVLAAADGQSEEVNARLSEYVGKHKERMTGFAFVEPTMDDISVKALNALQGKLGLKGVVLHCANCGFHPAHSRAMQFYESAQELKLPIFFHNGDSPLKSNGVLDFAQPYLIDEIARTFGDLKIVVGSMGVPFVEQTLSLVGKHQNVYADLTINPNNLWQVYNTVMAAHEAGVMEKLLFGSGWPFGNVGRCVEALLGFNRLLGDAELPPVPRNMIKGIVERDALTILGIEQ
jgi:predicted TIM-barrel fold metal-dependent hydrolase